MFLKLDSISSYYGNTRILREVSFEVPEGSCLCVLGRNGVGKTTLLRTIMGLMDKTTGRIELHGGRWSLGSNIVPCKFICSKIFSNRVN